jgi:TonB family protein
MRGPIGFLLLITAFSVFAADAPATLESRSLHHAMIVEVGSDAHFKVRVVDLQSNETLFDRELVGMPAQETADVGDLHITVRVGSAPYGITTTAEIEQGDTLIDSLHTVWTLVPHRAHLHAPGAMRVGGDVKAPIVVKRVDPIYADEARRDRISGIVIIEVLIDKTGSVKDALVLKGLPDGLSDAAMAAIKQWQFQPGTLKGEPVDVIFNLTINFKLDEAGKPGS